jgi:hypothetical protein
MRVKVGDICLKCKKGCMRNFPIFGTDFLMCSLNCGYKIYSTENIDNVEARFDAFMKNSWIPPAEMVIS